jgi:hypothetical protein
MTEYQILLLQKIATWLPAWMLKFVATAVERLVASFLMVLNDRNSSVCASRNPPLRPMLNLDSVLVSFKIQSQRDILVGIALLQADVSF